MYTPTSFYRPVFVHFAGFTVFWFTILVWGLSPLHVLMLALFVTIITVELFCTLAISQ